MKPRIPDVITGILLSIILMLLASCDSRRTETVKGKIKNEMVGTKDKGWTLKEGIELEDKILILNFSAKTRFDQNMKNLPYPEKNGFYEIPKGSGGANALQMENGEIVYFQKEKEYEVTGTLGELSEIGLAPLKYEKGENKKYSILSVKKIKMLDSNN